MEVDSPSCENRQLDRKRRSRPDDLADESGNMRDEIRPLTRDEMRVLDLNIKNRRAGFVEYTSPFASGKPFP